MTAFLIMFRESAEITLVIAAIYTIITKLNIAQLKKYLWLGVISGIGLSLLLAAVFKLIFGGLNEEIQEVIEIGSSIISILMISMTVLWFENADQFHQFILRGVEKTSKHLADWWVFILIFLTIVRDGIETIIFLFSSNQNSSNILYYGILGILAAIILGLIFYKGSQKTPLNYFFKITNILLLFFAANMFAHIFEEWQIEIGQKFGNNWSTILKIGTYLVYFGLFSLVYHLKKGRSNVNKEQIS